MLAVGDGGVGATHFTFKTHSSMLSTATGSRDSFYNQKNMDSVSFWKKNKKTNRIGQNYDFFCGLYWANEILGYNHTIITISRIIMVF